jgi:alpha-aminoadipic semialdehyde synthase
VTEIAVEDLSECASQATSRSQPLIKVVFKEEHMAKPLDAGRPFDLQEYYDHPERFRGTFERHLPYLDVLMNTIFWDARYPRLVTKEWARRHYSGGARPRLLAIGDISCDIEGSIELTLKTTEPDSPCFVYDPERDLALNGVTGNGPVIMAVDNLPCELPREASEHFSRALSDMVAELAQTDWTKSFAALTLSPHLKRAVIVHQGKLTPSYAYLAGYLGS